LIDNESTLQTGVGRIPNSVFPYLANKRDLGIHTETFTDGIIDLIEKGVITCRKKSLHQGKIVSSFCMGTNASMIMLTIIRSSNFVRVTTSMIRM